MESASFYQNVFLLIQAVPPSKEFLKHFREGMFEKPNTIGFLHVSHYLLTIYDTEGFKKKIQWPVFCKKSEAKYRNDVKDFLVSVSRENPDVEFPQILASHLVTPGGSKFTTIMWKLSVVTLRTFLKRETGEVLLAPKAGIGEDLSRMMLNNAISQNIKDAEEIHKNIVKIETEAEEYAKEMVDSIKKKQEELFLCRQSLIDLSSEAPIHPTMKKRLGDPNDIEVMQMWKSSFEESSKYLTRKEKRLRDISELSENVACMVSSIVSMDTNLLDGNRLKIIDTKVLSEIDELSPKTQIMLYRPYAKDGTLVLEIFLSLFSLFLTDLRRNLEKNEFPDLSGCEVQITASCEDVRSMSRLFHDLHDYIVELTCRVKNESKRGDPSSNIPLSLAMNHDLFDSVLLKSSPKININFNMEAERNEIHDRLELTPVENAHRALFSRHRRNNDATTPKSKLRPKLMVSRINFDETTSSAMSEKLSPVNRSVTSRMMDQWNANRGGKYARLFPAYHNRTSSRPNYSIRSVPSSSRINSITDMNSTSDVYNVSELRSHLVTTSKYNDNRDTAKKSTPLRENTNRASSTLNEDDTFVTPSSELLPEIMIEAQNDITEMAKSPKIRQAEKSTNRRASISDLVERYKKLRIKSTDVKLHMDFSSETSDESHKD